MPRLFIALPIPEDVADELTPLQSGVPDARWVPAENFHVTPVVTWDAYDFHNRPELGLDVPHAPALAPVHGDD